MDEFGSLDDYAKLYRDTYGIDIKKCIGCGYCCSMPCQMAYLRSSVVDNKCTELYWDKEAGRHWCRAIKEDPSLGDMVAIGGGCSSTLFNSWRANLKDRT